MEILILEFSSGSLIRVKLNEKMQSIFDKDADSFMSMLAHNYRFRLKDVEWMAIADGEDEVHDFEEEIEEEGKFLRVCSHCGKLMTSGYYLNGQYACSDECCLALYNGNKEEMEEDLSHAHEDCADYYYTEWESSISD